MAHVACEEYEGMDEAAAIFCNSLRMVDCDRECDGNCDGESLLVPAGPAEYVCAAPDACTPGPRARERCACPAVPMLAPVDQLVRSATLVFVFAAWLFDSDLMLFLAFVSLCVNMCICCGKPAVGCWMADVVIACLLLLVLLIRDTGYVVHVVFHGDGNATRVPVT
jgi:hypothetical protein